MPDWNGIMEEAERLADELQRRGVDLSEAEKAVDYFVRTGCDETSFARYLQIMAEQPPMRSKKTRGYYQQLRRAWEQWGTRLRGLDKARAAGWAVRLARARS